jgi:DNA polymerase-3 subunit delta'
MLFSDIVGEDGAKNGMLNMWHNGNLPHALLIAGAEGTGGLPLALAMAQYIFCTNKSATDSCGVCASCNKTAKLEHADLHVTFPTIPPKPGTKAMSRYFIKEFREYIIQTPYGTTYDWLQFINAENKQGNITAEECREIIDTLNLKSYEGDKKIQIIWRPEYLGKEGNILLKLIEEPTPGTIIILVAENLEDILATILSRTQLIRLSPVSPANIINALVAQGFADTRRAAQVAHLANGSYTEALRLIKHAENDLFPDVKNWFNSLFTANGIAIAKFAEDSSKTGREQLKNMLQYVVQLLEQTMRVRYMPAIEPALGEEEARFVKRLSGTNISFEALCKMTESITDTIFYIERNAHSRTQLHTLSIRLQYIIQNRQLPVL